MLRAPAGRRWPTAAPAATLARSTGRLTRGDTEEAMDRFGERRRPLDDVLEPGHEQLMLHEAVEVRFEEVGVQAAGEIGKRARELQPIGQLAIAPLLELQRRREVLGFEAV